jgi:AraC family transcriptional regulator
MSKNQGLLIMRGFPDFNAAGFDIDQYNDRFKKGKVIIHASSSDIAYPEHWGCLSVKCAHGGNEYYRANHTLYAVNDDHYLILNEGQTYSSYIFSDRPVGSFTINFPASFIATMTNALLAGTDDLLSKPGDEPANEDDRGHSIEFIERLYPHDNQVSPVLRRLCWLALRPVADEDAITEAYYVLLERMFLSQEQVNMEIRKIKAAKNATRMELYKRLHYAKDYITSCYMNDITLQELAGIACLNSAYFLRQFSTCFSLTPYQYIIRERMRAAKHLLETGSMSVTAICFSVGYQDPVSFIKLFKRTYRLTPEVYRLIHGKKSFFTC